MIFTDALASDTDRDGDGGCTGGDRGDGAGIHRGNGRIWKRSNTRLGGMEPQPPKTHPRSNSELRHDLPDYELLGTAEAELDDRHVHIR